MTDWLPRAVRSVANPIEPWLVIGAGCRPVCRWPKDRLRAERDHETSQSVVLDIEQIHARLDPLWLGGGCCHRARWRCGMCRRGGRACREEPAAAHCERTSPAAKLGPNRIITRPAP
jgi:hypothetical protein